MKAKPKPYRTNDDQMVGGFIQTEGARRFFPLDPQPDQILIEDIAHALSQTCRFTGHTRVPYSTAQHSVLVAELVPAEDALWALLHDGSEAYLADIAKPIKDLPQMQGYRDLEAKVQKAVFERFGLFGPCPASVKRADYVMLVTEARDLMSPLVPGWEIDLEDARPERIEAWEPRRAKLIFLARFAELMEIQKRKRLGEL